MNNKCTYKSIGVKKAVDTPTNYKAPRMAVGFFLKNCDKAFLVIKDFPYDKMHLPRVGELVNLKSYEDYFNCELDFDFYHVRQIVNNLGNPMNHDPSWIEIVVDGMYYGGNN